jgi:hypothetical protein
MHDTGEDALSDLAALFPVLRPSVSRTSGGRRPLHWQKSPPAKARKPRDDKRNPPQRL